MDHRIIVAGPVGAGKSTAIATICDIQVVQPRTRSRDRARQATPSTIEAMDYGILRLDDQTKVYLYSAPGQTPDGLLPEIPKSGGSGLVLLLDNTREDPLADLEAYLARFSGHLDKHAVVIGITHMDRHPRPGLYSYQTRLSALGCKLPVFEVDARKPEDITTLLLGLLANLAPLKDTRPNCLPRDQ